MVKSNEEVKREIGEIENATIKEACELLAAYPQEIRKYLAHIAASICEVHPRSLLDGNHFVKVVHARWFFWYAYHRLTGEDYRTMAEMSKENASFGKSCIQNGVANMGVMVSRDPIWMKRWALMKRIIAIILERDGVEQEIEFPKTVTLKVEAPQGVMVELKKV